MLTQGNAVNGRGQFYALPTPAYHKSNGDGTYDSLCLKCFWTAAIGLSEASLADAEIEHVCGRVPALVGFHQSRPALH
jgi:hypothetical protein